MMKCPICGGEARLVREEGEYHLGHRRAVVLHEFYRCEACDECFYTPEQSKAVHERAVERLHSAGQLLLPEEIRIIREKYRLTQAEFEQLLGVGRNTITRWEGGQVVPNASAEALLRLIDKDPENARFLAQRHGLKLPDAA